MNQERNNSRTTRTEWEKKEKINNQSTWNVFIHLYQADEHNIHGIYVHSFVRSLALLVRSFVLSLSDSKYCQYDINAIPHSVCGVRTFFSVSSFISVFFLIWFCCFTFFFLLFHHFTFCAVYRFPYFKLLYRSMAWLFWS